MNNITTLRKIAKILFVMGIALILIAIGYQIIIRVIYERDKNDIIDHYQLRECEVVEIKSQDDYINTPTGCKNNSPIVVLRMNDDVKTEFLACKSTEVNPAFGISTNKEIDNYSCAHIKKFFDNYKKETNTTLEIQSDCNNLEYTPKVYIEYNDYNKKELMEFAKKIIKKNETLPTKHKYEVSIKYDCNNVVQCTYLIKDINKLAQNINYKE